MRRIVFVLAFLFSGIFLQAEPLGSRGEVKHEALDEAKQFLQLLRNQKNSEAWSSTTLGFKEVTSLPHFVKLLDKHAFLQTGKYEFVSIAVEGAYAELVLLFEKGKQLARVLMYMSKEEGNWRVFGIKVEDIDIGVTKANVLSEAFNEKPYHKAIEQFLERVKSKQVEEAYRKFTTKEFKEITNFSTFKQFFRKYPFFIQAEPDWQPIRFQGNTAYVLVFFENSGGVAYSAEFELSKENSEWKIMSLKVFNIYK